MNIIIPMAGRGTRLRPHTLTVPKPLLPIAGKPIVNRLVEDIAKLCNEPIEEVAFVIGDFGDEVPGELIAIAESIGAKGSVYTQDVALGTAHAVLCAKEALRGEVIVGFADTLFTADFDLNKTVDGTIWVKQVEDPSAFGVVKYDENNVITDFVEKPKDFVSDLAIIGIYHFKDGENLRNELQYLIDNDIRERGEYQITNALENMKNKGLRFIPGAVNEWMDCGNKNATVETNARILELNSKDFQIKPEQYNGGTEIIEPCYIGDNVVIEGSKIGPFVSIGDNTVIKNCVIDKTIIQRNVVLEDLECTNSMIGNYAKLKGSSKELSIGDYCTQE